MGPPRPPPKKPPGGGWGWTGAGADRESADEGAPDEPAGVPPEVDPEVDVVPDPEALACPGKLLTARTAKSPTSPAEVTATVTVQRRSRRRPRSRTALGAGGRARVMRSKLATDPAEKH